MNKIFNRNKPRKTAKKRKSRQWIIAVNAAGIIFGFTVVNSRAINTSCVKNEELTISRPSARNEKELPKRFSIPAEFVEAANENSTKLLFHYTNQFNDQSLKISGGFDVSIKFI